MPDLPRGTVTLLFTDIEGSTRLLRRLGNAYGGVLAEHQRLLRAAFAAHGGHEVDTQGDSFFVSFSRAGDAAAAAAAAQRALAAQQWPDGVAVRVRMGLHTGEPDVAGAGYVGLAVHLAARVGAAAHGGQVLLSTATQAVLQDRLPEGLTLRDLGEHRLKDFDRPERLYQLVLPDLPSDFPPLRTPDAGDGLRQAAPFLTPPPLLVGREREQTMLRERLGAALGGRGGAVLIGGEAGIGKTTLAEGLMHEAATYGALTLAGRCYDLIETPPYGPWLDLFAHYSATADGPTPPTALISCGAAVEVANQATLFGEVLAFFTRLASRQPVVLLLDDLHWADPASLDLLRALARELGRLPLLLLGTYRADELTRRHPLYSLLPLLVREARTELLDLRRLGREDVRALVRAQCVLPPAEEARLVTALLDHAEGNPFFTGELLRSLGEEGLLRQGESGWTLGDLAQARVPPLLRQVIDTRLARLDEETQRHLAVAAVIGQRVPLQLWAAVTGTLEETLLDATEEAIGARVLEAADGGADVRFVHALIREALYEGILPPRRRLWHRRVAEALLAEARPDPDLVASHLQRAGDQRAATWLIRAGERAQHAYALLTAAERFEAALTLLEGQGGDPRERARLLYRLSRMRRYADPRGAIAYLDDAEALAQEARDELLAAYIACARGYLRCTVGQIRRGLAELEAQVLVFDALTPDEQARLARLQELLGDPPDTQHYRGALASWLALAGRYAEALTHGERVVGGTSAPPMRGAGTSFYANACRGLASAHAALGRPAEARRLYTRAGDAYRAAEHWYQVGNTLGLELYEVVLPYMPDDLTERRRLATAAEEAWARASDALADLPRHLAHLPLLLLEGGWAEARELALAVRAPGSRTQWRPFASSFLARLARDQGDAALAWSLVRERLPEGAAGEPGDAIFLDVLSLQRLAAALALDANDLPAARSWLDAHDRWTLWADCLLGQAEGCLLWARYHRATGDLTRARAAAAEALERAKQPRQPLVLLAAHRMLGELNTAPSEQDEASAHFDAALALADTCGATYERALTQLALAGHHAATGDHAAAQTTLSEARVVFTDLGAAPALTEAEALARQLLATGESPAPTSTPPAGLSAREVEVLRLVAEGLTDAEVAARLFLSPRTVSGHLRSIYAKLGISSRSAATRLAIEYGLR